MEYGYAIFTMVIFIAVFYAAVKAISWRWRRLIREAQGNGHRPPAQMPVPGAGLSEKTPDWEEMTRELKSIREESVRMNEKLSKVEGMLVEIDSKNERRAFELENPPRWPSSPHGC